MSENTFRSTLDADSIALFKKKVLSWAKQFEVCCLLDSNDYQQDDYAEYEFLFAAKPARELISNQQSFEKLKAFHNDEKSWLFGFFCYDLKNEVENLQSNNFDGIRLPHLYFFEPSILITIKNNTVEVSSSEPSPQDVFNQVMDKLVLPRKEQTTLSYFQPAMPRVQYLETVHQIKNHIVEGDIYEMNFCQEWYATVPGLDPYVTYDKFNDISSSPFAAFFRLHARSLMCQSPERFLKKTGDLLISQPIKGTVKRGTDVEEDERLKLELANSEKDKAENIMIVDLVRNDLSKSCIPGTVEVPELFSVYDFEHVFQMISTVTGKIKKDVHFVDAIKNAFPMGSMTGAPKVMSMQLIEHYELSKRGLYSGALGYIKPEGDFDFNVVIRSLLFNSESDYLSYHAGGAIVYDSDSEKEYDETVLKASGMMKVFLPTV
ncbi:MAG: anthranilate synthase component I family protein [Bacteroidota bacterium]